ncbi:hypothetical protein CDL15_Pgr007987 [Punica granatum]|uniref:Uncharacterized protein n=1 Tax=Punica granatum TaxID=22663 RepID=A0A218WYH2_PUNGR|nr:hypothetical protein CDL15_Pgr007987 [Punica granatum]
MVHESKLAGVSIPDKVARGTSEVASANLRCRKVNSQGLADPGRLQEARARWLGELAVTESELARTGQGCKRHERGGSAKLRCRKVSFHGLADRARLQEARARWLGEIAMQENRARLQDSRGKWLGELSVPEIKLARVNRPSKVERGQGEVAWRTFGGGDPPRLQEARASWLGELAVLESKLARVSRPYKVARGTSKVARRTCGAGK